MTKVAVIGVGHLGKQHARLYSNLEGAELVAVIDILTSRAKECGELYQTAAYTDYRDRFGKVDAESLAVPPIDHARSGIDLFEQGIDVLVEKPMSSTAEA